LKTKVDWNENKIEMNEEGSEISQAESSLEAHTQDKTQKNKRHPFSHNFAKVLSLFKLCLTRKEGWKARNRKEIKVK